ncbi:hypothetical protein QWZ13_10535 [Reinekea marina]|nr:hypothetical protein [Reinekea marina]MDN3649347.1 hypothetical protein [Reinekea marina]
MFSLCGDSNLNVRNSCIHARLTFAIHSSDSRSNYFQHRFLCSTF